MHMTEFKYANLPVKPAMFADEWIDSHLVRLARANGRSEPSERDVSLLRTNCVSTDGAGEGLPAGYLASVPTWAKKKQGAVIRYCPACFEEGRYVRGRWRLKTFEVCTLHDLNIKRGCTEPALLRAITHRDVTPLTDLESGEIWEGASCPMPDARLHAKKIWSDFEAAVAVGRKEEPTTYLAWALVTEYLLDAAVTAELGFEVPLKGESRIYHRTRWLRDHKVDIHASQDGVLRFLLAIDMNNQRRAVASRLREIIQQPGHGASIFACLPLQYLLDRLLAAAPETNATFPRGVLPVNLHPPGYASVNHALEVLGRSPGFVEYLIRANFFQGLHRVRFGKRQYTFIPETELEGCRRWLSGCMTPDEVMRELAIDRPLYFALGRSEVLLPIEIGCWSLFRKDDIAALISKLDGFARPHAPSRSQLVPLVGSWIRSPGKMPLEYDALLKEIWQGQLPIYRKLDETGLRAYYVGVEVLKRAQQLRAEVKHLRRVGKADNRQMKFLECQ